MGNTLHMKHNPLAPFRNLRGTNPADSGSGQTQLTIPVSAEDWRDRYEWLERAYYGEPYSDSDHVAMTLFRAEDTSGDSIAETRRLLTDWRFVVDTDAAALAGGELQLEAEPGQPDAVTAAGRTVWRRSSVDMLRGDWAISTASLGDFYIEAVRQTDGRGAILVGHNPRFVTIETDPLLRHVITKATITIAWFEPPPTNSLGETSGEAVGHVDQRILTQDRVIHTRDGRTLSNAPHLLGVVPLVHMRFLPFPSDPEHGLSAAHGLEQALGYVDAAFAQVRAAGVRMANPIGQAKGFKLDADSDVFKLGRILSGVPTDGDFSFIEADMSGTRALLEAAREARAFALSTMPEFLFSSAGANTSGEALRLWAGRFVIKMTDVRSRWYANLARATEYAVAMDEGRAYDEAVGQLRIKGAPILAVDKLRELEVLEKAKAVGLLPTDVVRHLKRLGMLPPETDAAAYAQEIEDRKPVIPQAPAAPFVGEPSEDEEAEA